MPTIVFACPKGGVGKTTTATVLACMFSREYPVTLVDADPNRPIAAWSRKPGCPENLTVISDVSETNIIEELDKASSVTPFVVVDLEGTASTTVAYAISRADLVIIPMQPSQLDGDQMAKAVKFVERQEKAFNRRIPRSILFTRTSAAIRLRDHKDMLDDITKYGVDVFESEIIERSAFKAMFRRGGTLFDLDRKQVSGVDQAYLNAKAFTMEVVQKIKAARNEAAASVGGGEQGGDRRVA